MHCNGTDHAAAAGATIGDKHEDVIAKMGAIMAAGILDASTLLDTKKNSFDS
jgi:hypothetical protein